MCTSFAVYNQNGPIYGMNFDTADIDMKLKICTYDKTNVFYLSCLVDDNYIDCAGFNSNGLLIYAQALEYNTDFSPICDKNGVFALDLFYETLMKAGSVSDYSEILNNRTVFFPPNPLFTEMGVHILVADMHGDALILEEGINANVISRIKDNFIIMTNFPNGNFHDLNYDKVSGNGADRYIKAYEYIKANIHNFGLNEAIDILRKTSQETTLCSMVFDPHANVAYISFKADFGKWWKIFIGDKTIQSLDGLAFNKKLLFVNGEIMVKDLIDFYK